jgi:xanthine dehydrogenase YagT iron-sulfur-binding subunit
MFNESGPPEENAKDGFSAVGGFFHFSRREFIGTVAVGGVGLALSTELSSVFAADEHPADSSLVPVEITINKRKQSLRVQPRATLLDLLRERLGLTGSKKGCDHGQCGACTTLVNGRRVNSCLTLAALCDKAEVTTIEGLGTPEKLHPVQAAFVKHDAFQCGYCTPGQICSAVGLLSEGHARTDDEIRELMSGNICRCGAYQNILAAIKEAKGA